MIYQDSFARTGLLNGSMPDTADTTGAKYIAGPLAFTGNWTDQNGNTENACYFSNSLPAALGPLYNVSYLPINVETGHVYTLTASFLVNTNYTTWWMFLAYASTPSLAAVQGQWTAGMLLRSTNKPGTGNGNLQAFTGAGTGGGLTVNFTPTSLIQPQFITLTAVLNLANPAAITEYWYTNGVAFRTNICGATLSGVGANNGMWPHYVSFGQSGCSGYVTNFSFTDVMPAPAGPTILEQPNNLTAPQGQTATFWVNAVGTPDPTYQWMSNGVAIVGATNATYTTPALNQGYNGVGYSVGVTNVAGGVTSSSATLTVAAGSPTVYSVTKTASSTAMVVNFSGAVDPTTSQNAANYTLNNGASVVSVSAGSVPSSVVLTTSALNPTAAYYLTVQNVQDLFGDAMAAASTNVVLPAGLVLDLKGDSGVQVDASGNVAQWLDQTTNGNNASQFFGMSQSTSGLNVPSTTARPTTNTIINGLQTLTFSAGAYTFLQAASTPSVSINTNLTIYCVAQVSDLSANRHFISKNVGNIPASFELDGNNNGGLVGPDLISGAAGVGNVAVTAGGGVVGVPHVFAATRACVATYTNSWNGVSYPAIQTNWYYVASNTVSLYLDGVQTRSNAVVNENAPGLLDGQQPVYIGTRQDHYTGDIMNGQIAEILLFNTALSAADITNVDNYLGMKWFTPSFLTATPTITTSNGFAVTISPGPSYGSVHTAYQWQENGTNIPGATGPSYTTSILAPSDNNDTFSLIMSVPNTGATYTNTTTLSVLNMPPYVTSAGIPIWNTNQVIVLFDEAAVDPITATTAGNYSLNNGASVLSAAIGDAPNKVILTTSGLTWSANPGFYALTVQNVRDLYGNTIVTASPSVGLYPPATALWVNINTSVTTNASGGVTLWNDLSGNGNNLHEYAPSADPLLTTNAIGRMVARFNATNSSLLYAGDAPSLEITNNMSIFAVANFATLAGGTNGHILSKTGSTTTTPPHGNQPGPYDYYTASSGLTFYRGNGVGANAAVGSRTGPAIGLTHLVEVMQQGTTVTHRLDGNTNGTGTLSTTIADAGQPLLVGSRSDFVQRLTGDVSEIILIGSALDTNDVASLESYLAAEYNVPLGTNSYPAIAPQPVASTNVYQTTTLTVPVGVSGNPLAYQWYDTTGAAIAGQISATLVIPNMQTNDTYYLVVTNIYGSVTSSNVAVTVIPVNTNPTNIVFSITNNQMLLSWPADHKGWQLQAQTNSLSAGLGTNWVKVAGSSTTNQVAVPINPTNGSVFLRLVFPPQ